MRVGGPIDINTVPNPNGRVFVVDTVSQHIPGI
jgi:hypothetical protein